PRCALSGPTPHWIVPQARRRATSGVLAYLGASSYLVSRIRLIQYEAADIEVLSVLDPVRKRPGMFTNTSQPNHIVQEVVDNSVDEALAGHASHIEVELHADGSIGVTDDSRGRPVDLHPVKQAQGVESILTRLRA